MKRGLCALRNVLGSHFGLPSSFSHRITGLDGWRFRVSYDVCTQVPFRSKHDQSEKFLDLGTVTRPPSSSMLRARKLVRCMRSVHSRKRAPVKLVSTTVDFRAFSRKSTTPDHTTPAYSGIRRQTSLFKCSSENCPRPYLRNDTMFIIHFYNDGNFE